MMHLLYGMSRLFRDSDSSSLRVKPRISRLCILATVPSRALVRGLGHCQVNLGTSPILHYARIGFLTRSNQSLIKRTSLLCRHICFVRLIYAAQPLLPAWKHKWKSRPRIPTTLGCFVSHVSVGSGVLHEVLHRK